MASQLTVVTLDGLINKIYGQCRKPLVHLMALLEQVNTTVGFNINLYIFIHREGVGIKKGFITSASNQNITHPEFKDYGKMSHVINFLEYIILMVRDTFCHYFNNA